MRFTKDNEHARRNNIKAESRLRRVHHYYGLIPFRRRMKIYEILGRKPTIGGKIILFLGRLKKLSHEH